MRYDDEVMFDNVDLYNAAVAESSTQPHRDEPGSLKARMDGTIQLWALRKGVHNACTRGVVQELIFEIYANKDTRKRPITRVVIDWRERHNMENVTVKECKELAIEMETVIDMGME
jgi:hypothetical protein